MRYSYTVKSLTFPSRSYFIGFDFYIPGSWGQIISRAHIPKTQNIDRMFYVSSTISSHDMWFWLPALKYKSIYVSIDLYYRFSPGDFFSNKFWMPTTVFFSRVLSVLYSYFIHRITKVSIFKEGLGIMTSDITI